MPVPPHLPTRARRTGEHLSPLCLLYGGLTRLMDGQVEPTVFSETMNDINELLIKAHDPSWACFDNSLAVLTLYTSPFLLNSKYERVSGEVLAVVEATLSLLTSRSPSLRR